MASPVRKAGQKSSGGYLNGVSGSIDAITFKAGKSGEGKNGPWQKYSGVVLVTPDGGKQVPQFLDAGFLPRGCSISEDGTTIEGGKYYLTDDNQFGKFVNSLFEPTNEGANGVGDALDGGLREYSAISGIRVTFQRNIDVEATIAAGLGKLKSKKKIADLTEDERKKAIDAGKRPMKKDGKELKDEKGNVRKAFLDQLLVAEVLSLPETKPATKKATAKTTAKPAAKPAPAAPSTDFDLDEADELVKTALEGLTDKDGNTVPATRNALGSAFVKASLGKTHLKTDSKLRESLRKFVISDDYLTGAVDRAVVILDGEGKDERVQLVA